MTLLPIADRELRVSARSKATHRLRIIFAVGAVVIAGAIGLISLTNKGMFTPQLGMIIFGVLKWIGFIYACLAGVILTADCLSEEKREGTLGLLFLTDLRGYDVVLGKLAATSLRSFYSLLAVFPVMAFSFVLGGVAPGDFSHAFVALCNTLFFSLALGMLVSVVSRDANKAMTTTMAAMLVFLFAKLFAKLHWLSPFFAFKQTASYRSADFWRSTLTVHLEGWCFLALASWLITQTWHEKGIRRTRLAEWRIPFIGVGTKRRKLLDQDPICWIVSRDRWASNISRLAVVVIVVVLALNVVLYAFEGGSPAMGPTVTSTNSSGWTTNSVGPVVTINGSSSWASNSTGNGSTYNYHTTSTVVWSAKATRTWLYSFATSCVSILSLVLELWLATFVARFYIDGTRNGFMELLLVTPVRPLDILRGHWLALRKLFLVPVAALFVLSLAAGMINFIALSGTSSPAAQVFGDIWGTLFVLVAGQIGWLTGLFAIAWFSIWMGISSKKVNVAVLKTFCFVKILPWFCVIFATFLSAFFIMMALKASGMWFIEAIPSLLIIVINFVLIGLARHNTRDILSRRALL